MLKNYFKITLRNIRQQKLYSGLNVFGLALGIASAIVIFLFVAYENSYDRFFDDADDLYRIVERQPGNVFRGNDRFVVTPASLAGELRTSFAAIEAATTFNRIPVLFTEESKRFYEYGLWADTSFLKVFSYEVLAGDVSEALQNPSQLLLTESLAKKLYGAENPLGKIVDVRWWSTIMQFEVGGIIQDPPANSHLTFQFLLPMMANPEYQRHLEQTQQNSYLTYLKLKPGNNPNTIASQLPAFVQRYLGEHADRFEYFIEPVVDIHLHADANFDIGIPGDIQKVYLFGIIGVLILLLACVNYMNLAIARSMKRAKEVGLRKVIGARKWQVAGQFMMESVLMSGFAFILGLLLVNLFLPLFAELVERPLAFNWQEPWLLGLLVSLVLLVGVVSGSYPAFFMSRLKPVHTLKGGQSKGHRRSVLQSSLIVLQYTVSIGLIAGSLTIYEQLQFIENKEVGYERDRIVTMPLRDVNLDKTEGGLLDRLRAVPGVERVTAVSDLPTNIGSSQGVDSWEGSVGGDEVTVYAANVEYDFFDLFDVELAAGRTFSRAISSDTVNAVLLNEAAVLQLGWTSEEAIGKRFMEDRQVIGVMKDFHLHSLHLPIAPMMVSMNWDWYGHVAVRVKQANAGETIAELKEILSAQTPYPVSHEYMDDVYNQLYMAEIKLGKTIGYFAFFAVLIASLGLFGLAAYATERRTKEIGVRKVLGASVPGLMALLSREFIGLVLISIVLAWPLAYLLTARWLEGFAYKIEFGPGVLILTALLAVLIAVITVSYQATRVALSNPVKALRYE